MIIVDDDRKSASLGVCENCQRDDVLVRHVESVGWSGESRGFYSICFECFGARLTWRLRESGRMYMSPVTTGT